MNIALSAVIIFVLLLPPIAFYLAYNFGRFPKAAVKLGLLEGLMLSAIFSIILHAVALYVIKLEIRFDVLALLMGGDLKTFKASVDNNHFRLLFISFTVYNAALTFSGLTGGLIFRWIVNKLNWHARSEALRLYNQWWYLFRGIDGRRWRKSNPI